MTDSAIERYLDQLFHALHANPPRDARSLLSETEGHLRDAAEEAERSGMPRADAELAAIERFGDVRHLAELDRNRTATHVITRIVMSAWSLGCIGAMALGASGLIAGLMRGLGASTTFIAGNRTTTNLNATDCARWLAGSPHAHSCAQAALNDWTAEIIGYRIVLGVIGAVALAALWAVRRRSLRVRTWRPLPDTIVNTIATTIFGIAALWLTGLGVDAWIVRSGDGAGFWLSAAPVAFAAALVFGLRLVHDLQSAT